MEIWYLMDNDNLLDQCLAASKKMAEKIFAERDHILGDVISEADYIIEKQQNAYEAENM